MKKLMTLMFLGLAAFAGGGLMNEHNLTTAVNYLYHKQQVGNVINLGTIADTPPSDLPPTLPATPGAVPKGETPSSASQPLQASLADPAEPSKSTVSPPAAGGTGPAPLASAGAANRIQGAAGPDAATSVPGTAPPPISIRWPDESVSTFRTSPNAPENTASVSAVPPASQSQMQETLPPPLAESAPIAALAQGSTIPHVPPPQIQQTINQPPPVRDDRIDRASSVEPVSSKSGAGTSSVAFATWREIEARMDALGVVRYEILGSPGAKKKFRCEIDIAGAPKFEAESEDVTQAAQFALKRIVLFHAARKAAVNPAAGAADSSIASDSKPGRIPPANALAVPRPVSPGREPAGYSSAPLAPPPDLPN
ncbi:hypothetical protein GC170_03355 [bacterium]|nr:hypothetical protein [bacterium]